MTIDKDTARKVAHLARIEINEADLEKVAGELNGILGFMEQLSEVDVKGVAPMTSVTQMHAALRKDEITDGGNAERVLANAPLRHNGFFAVPKVVE